MFSDETACKIDIAVSDILKKAYDRAYSILQEHKDQLEKLTEALVERETMSDAEIRDLLGFEPYCKTE